MCEKGYMPQMEIEPEKVSSGKWFIISVLFFYCYYVIDVLLMIFFRFCKIVYYIR